MPLPPLVPYLEVAEASHFRNAFWIPLAQLRDRVSELPPKAEPIRLLTVGDYEAAVALLESLGRRVVLQTPDLGAAVAGDPSLGEATAGRLWSPNPFLETCLATMAPGRALDLGCGMGREAIAMAGLGWQVTAVDRLPDALDRARVLADRYLSPLESERIDWRVVDLETQGLLFGEWDLVTLFFYFDRELLAQAPSRLAPGGSLIIEAFTEEHSRHFGRPSRASQRLEIGEVQGLFPGAKIVRIEEGPLRGRFTARAQFLFP